MRHLSHKTVFKQAVIGDHPDILQKIHHPQVNLAVWQDAVKAPSVADYLNQLDLAALCADQEWHDDYYKIVTSAQHCRSWDHETRRAALQKIDSRLEQAGFPQAEAGKGATRHHLAAQAARVAEHFARAMRVDRAGFSLLIFRSQPQEGLFWHTDEGKERGIVTLSGDHGTLWLPEYALPKGQDRQSCYWDEPLEQAYGTDLPVQAINPGDMAIIKCAAQEKPLVHASPSPCPPRLVMLMAAPGRG